MAGAGWLAGCLLSRIRCGGILYRAADTDLVREHRAAELHTAELGFCAGVDDALHADGNCGVAGVAAAGFAKSHLGAGHVLAAAGVEFCVEFFIF